MSRVKPSRGTEEEHVGADRVRPLSRKQRKELEGYISWSTELFRVFVFLLVLGVVAVLAKLVHTALVAIVPSASHDAWWVTPVLLSGIALFVFGGRGTGGKCFRASVRRDLAEGVLTVRRVTVAEAIEVE